MDAGSGPATQRPNFARELLNLQYSVFVGAIVSFSFYADSTGVHPAVDLRARPEVLLFTIYFLLDWFTINITDAPEMKACVRTAPLSLRVPFVAILGLTVIALNGSGWWKFCLLAMYLLIATIHSLWYTWGFATTVPTPSRVISLIGAGVGATISVYLSYPALLGFIGREDVLSVWDDPSSPSDQLCLLMTTLLITKGFRAFDLWHTSRELT